MSSSSPAKTLTLSLQDVISRRAYLRVGGEAKIKLLQKAGAPWADRDPLADLSEFQKEVLKRRERHLIVHGGSRLGKSVLGGGLGICELMLPHTFTAFIAGRYEHVNDEWKHFAAGLKRLFGEQPFAFTTWVHKHKQNYYAFEVETVWGSRAVGYAVDVDSGEVLLGKEFSRVIVGEGSRVNPEVGETRIKRALDGRLMNNKLREESGYLTMFTTPDGYEGLSSHEWDRIETKTKGDLSAVHYGRVPFAETYWLREASVLENPAYDTTVFDARKREAEAAGDTAAFEEQYLGLRTYASGRVFREFMETKHRVNMPPPELIRRMRLGIGIDTGACFGAILAGLDKERKLWWLGEVYLEKRHIRDCCADVRTMVVDVLGPVYDSADFNELAPAIDIWVADPASQVKVELSEYLGDIAIEHPARGQGKFEQLPTIDQLREMMHDNKFHLVHDLAKTHEQIKKWVWKRTKTGERQKLLVVREPVKGNDHCLDAGRFVSIPLMELGPQDEPPVIVSFSQSYSDALRQSAWSPLRKIMEEAEEAGGIMC